MTAFRIQMSIACSYRSSTSAMSAQKRPWTCSVFRQFSGFEGNTTEVPQSELEQKKKFKRHLSDCDFSFKSTTASNTDQICQQTNIVNNSNWIEAFAPQSLDDIAVHPKKILELENWLKRCIEVQRRRLNPAELCLLTGPAGAGKTTAARLTAKVNGYQLLEWINPLDQELITTLGEQRADGAYAGSQVEAFKAFLLRGSRYKSLLEQSNRRLLMVEDFPNALLNDASQFESILDEYRKYGKSPLLFIAADAKSRALNISYNLFTEPVKDKFQIQHISFNPIAVTLLQKAMKRFCTLMRQPDHANVYEIPPQALLDSIVVTAQGDIRNALLNLHFASLKGAAPIAMKRLPALEVNKAKKLRNAKQQSRLKSVGCDESVSMLHALGRALNPKLNEERGFVHSPETISDNFATEPKQFIDLLFANYLPHFSDIEQVTAAANGLSISDLIVCEYREDVLPATALNVAVRSLMVANSAPVPGWMPVRGKHRAERNLTEREARMRQRMCGNVTSSLYASDYRTYVELIGSESERKAGQ